MRIENFEGAVVAFQNVVAMREDDGESFSNLAVCLLTLGRIQEAHTAATQAVRFDRRNAKVWENFVVIALQAERRADAIHGVEEVTRELPKWCNCPLIAEVIDAVFAKGGDRQRLLRVLEVIAENADANGAFYGMYGDTLEAAGENERAYEIRKAAVDAAEVQAAESAIGFQRLVEAAERLAGLAAQLPARARGATQRIRALIRKYEDGFGETEDYAKLAGLLEKIKSE
jgi:tetratricopeptide (TPR) repeat protein